VGYRGETALSRTALSRDLSESAESGGVGLELRSTEKWLFIPVVDPDPLLLALKTRFLHAGTPAIQRKGRLSGVRKSTCRTSYVYNAPRGVHQRLWKDSHTALDRTPPILAVRDW